MTIYSLIFVGNNVAYFFIFDGKRCTIIVKFLVRIGTYCR